MASTKLREKKNLLKKIFRVVSIVRTRESRLRAICDTLWLEKLKFLNVGALMRKFKFVIGNSSLRTLFELQKKHLFDDSQEMAELVVHLVRRRNLRASSYAEAILKGWKN